jgi:hypothetical protein
VHQPGDHDVPLPLPGRLEGDRRTLCSCDSAVEIQAVVRNTIILFKPQAHIFVTEAPPWDVMDSELKRFPKYSKKDS